MQNIKVSKDCYIPKDNIKLYIVMLCGKMFVSKENRGLYTTIQMGKKLCRLYILKTGSWY